MLSQSMFAMFVQGSSFKSSYASCSNFENHNHIPDSTGGTIIIVPYGSSSQFQDDSYVPSQLAQHVPQQFYLAHPQLHAPYFPLSNQFPSESYDFGFVGNSSDHNGLSSKSNVGT